MRIDRRLMLLGVMLVVLSMTMATQYTVTRIGYSYALVHPSEADIRFIGSDNASGGARLLRVNDNTSNQYMTLELGNWTVGQNTSYSAAFGIVNEEDFAVNITHVNISGASNSEDYMRLWVHSDRDANAKDEAAANKVLLWDTTSDSLTTSQTCAWQLAAGDHNSSNMSAGAGTNIATPWDDTSHVRFSLNDANNAANGTSDFVWVQIEIDIPQETAPFTRASGQIWIHFKASTH